jgi:hypothetical protein
MAIGDTVQAGLMRFDSSAYERAGQANAQANAAFGNALNQVARGFLEGQEKKARTEEMTGYLMNQGVSESDAKAIAKNPFLQKEYQRKKETEAQMEIEKNRLAMQAQSIAQQGKIASEANMLRKGEFDLKKQARDQEKADRQILEKFSEDLISETTDPEIVSQVEEARPGMFALGNEAQRNRFLDFQQEQQPKVAVGELGSSDFARVARERGFDPTLAGQRFMSLQKAEAELADSTLDDETKEVALRKEIETSRQLFEKPLANIAEDFGKDQQVKDFKNVKVSYDTIQSVAENPTAAGDLSLIFAYMKVLDPNSSVREGEFANAQNAAGVPERVRNLFNQWKDGQRLSDEQRNDFVLQARKLAEARQRSIEPAISQARQKFERVIRSQKRNLSPDAANRLFEEIVAPDIRLANGNQIGMASPPPPINASTLPSGGTFTPAP